jgi:hypothetical protein
VHADEFVTGSYVWVSKKQTEKEELLSSSADAAAVQSQMRHRKQNHVSIYFMCMDSRSSMQFFVHSLNFAFFF